MRRKIKSILGWWKFRAGTVLVLFLFLHNNNFTHAQSNLSAEQQVKAAFLYNFTRFIDWPNSAFKTPDESFVIGIIGKNPFGDLLKQLVMGEKVGNHPIEIVQFNSVKEIKKCHLLYINLTDPEKIKTIINKYCGPGVLAVGDVENFVRWGGHIRFFVENNKIRFQINVDSAKASGVTISSKLLNVAQIY